MMMRQLVFTVLGTALLVAPACSARAAQQQQQQESLADAARKAQAQKKTSTKPVKVITDDNLDDIKGKINVVGTEPAPPEKEADASAEKKTAPGEVKGEAYWRTRFADARQKLADDSKELDILQREYNLLQQQYYSDPNTAMQNQYNRKDLTDKKQKIDEKTAAVAADKQAISDLEDELRKSGGDAGWAREPN